MILTAKHAIITDECRTNRTDKGAFLEGVLRLYEEYEILTRIYEPNSSIRLHLKLEVEFPEAGVERALGEGVRSE